MRPWLASHKERILYGAAVALLVVSIGSTSAGAVVLRESANNQRQEFRLEDLSSAIATDQGVAAALDRVAAHDRAAGRRLRAVPPRQLEAGVKHELLRLRHAANSRYPVARWTLITGGVAFVLLVGVLIWLYGLQRRAGRIDRDNARLRDEFVAVVSHELRTPLTSILGYVELIEDDGDGTLSDDQRSYFEVVKRNADRLHSLVSDLLLVAETDNGSVRLDVHDVDLAALVADSVEAARAAADRKDVELRASAGEVHLAGDPLRLAQMLDNLLSNAIKFTPDGGLVSVRAGLEDDHALLEVEDSGVGISVADRQHIFERFYRSARNDTVGGAGLGLAITKAIVEAHGGSIAVQSQLGVGTTFRVRLPLGR
ncbi:MAG: HAMP domain-containing sensor histidine kinase [Actinomycetota bacterium]